MDLDIASVAALIRNLPDADLVRMLNVYRDSAAGASPRSPAAASSTAGAAAPPRERVAGASRLRGPASSPEDVALITRCVGLLMAKNGPQSKKQILAETSDPSWVANGWTQNRVETALATALTQGTIATVGQARATRYVAPAPADDPPADDAAAAEGAPAEVSP